MATSLALIQSYPDGIDQTDHCLDGQQVGDKSRVDQDNTQAIWKACEFVLQFNFNITHLPGRMNTAADILYCLETDPKRPTKSDPS